MKRTHQRSRLTIPILIVILIGFIVMDYRTPAVRTYVSRLFAPRIPAGDTVSPKQLHALLNNKNFTFINVHTPYEGEIEQTDSIIEYDKITTDSAGLPQDKASPIILYCRTGNMSSQAMTTLRKLGYTNVHHLAGGMEAWKAAGYTTMDLSKLEGEVIPEKGIELPIAFGDLLGQIVSKGVLDLTKFKTAVTMTTEQEALFTQSSQKHIVINRENSQFIVDVLWAIGLAQKSVVYDRGPMGTTYKADAGTFASTGGWNLGQGPAMEYYNKFDLIPLSAVQQNRVAEISKHVYRPCCGNATWFPDCNHGMAALAAIEMMVAKDMDDTVIYRNVLALNSYWFSDTYLTTAVYFARQGVPWSKVDAMTVLGEEFSGGRGASLIQKKVGPLPWRPAPSGGGCSA